MKRKGKGSDPKGASGEELPGRVLKVFRVARGASQEDLSRALGRGDNYVSRLESGMVERAVFEEAVELLGSPRPAVDWTADFVGRLDATALAAGENTETQRHLCITAELSRWIEGLFLAALERAGRAMDQQEEAHQAQILIERLRWQLFAGRVAMVRESAVYHHRCVVLRLCEESLAATADSADHAREWAELAVLAARLAPGKDKGRAQVLGHAMVHLANALRVKGELREADRVYAEGLRLWQQGAGAAGREALNEARVLGFGASLRRDQRRFKEALVLLDRALKVDKGKEAPYLLVNKAKLLREEGDLEGAVKALQKAEPILAQLGDSRLLFIARLNFVDHLSVLGLFDEASRRLPAIWHLTSDHAGELDRIRLVWVQGRVAAGTGREAEGIIALEQVWRDFHHRGMAYDAALTALELAALRLRQGETGKVKALARQVRPVFESQEVHREALAALAFFCQAAEQECATQHLMERLVRYLHRARHNPELHFEPVSS